MSVATKSFALLQMPDASINTHVPIGINSTLERQMHHQKRLPSTLLRRVFWELSSNVAGFTDLEWKIGGLQSRCQEMVGHFHRTSRILEPKLFVGGRRGTEGKSPEHVC